jgi:ribonuclease VapC
VLDAPAVMALLHDEEGASAVVGAIAGATISVVNWAEALSNVAADGDDPREVAERLSVTGEEAVIWIEALTAADCMEVARLRPVTKAHGLSLADRACLVLAERLGVQALNNGSRMGEGRCRGNGAADPMSSCASRAPVVRQSDRK